MAGVVIGAIIGSAASEVVGAAVADAVTWSLVDAGVAMGSEIAVGSFIGGAAGLVAGGLANMAVQTLIGPNAPSQAQSAVASAQAQGILINSQSNVDPIPVIYGRRRVGGTRVFIEVSGASHEYLHVVIVLPEGPVAAIDNVYIDDVLSTDPKFAGLVTINKHLGTAGDAADATLMAAVPKWTSACTLAGLAYLYVQLKYDSNAFSGLPTITADVRGRTLYDPRDGGTRYGNNPALVVRDYLTNALYGRGITASSIDDASITAAANACDVRLTAPAYTDTCTADPASDLLTFAQAEPIDTGDGLRFTATGMLPAPLAAGTTYYAIKATDTTYRLATSVGYAFAGTALDLTGAGSGTITVAHVDYATYAVDGAVDTSQTAYDNIKALLTACRGMLVFSAGKYRLVLDQAATPASFGFTEDNITGSWVITQAGKRTKFNRVTAGFYNPAKMWQPDLAMVESTALRAVDNGLLLEAKIDLPFTANGYRAQNIGQQTLNQSRYGLVVKFAAFQEGLRCEVGDVVPITHSTPGWTGKLFRILQIELKDNDEVTVVAQEYDPSVYQLTNLAPASIVPRSNLPDPFSVPPVSGLTLTSGTSELLRLGDGSIISRIKAAWNLPGDAYAQKGQVEIQFKRGADLTWTPADVVAADLTATWIAPVQDGMNYDVRLRSINAIGVRGPWAQASVTVVGKTAPPSDVAAASAMLLPDGILLSWSPVTDADLAQYEIRSGGTSFANALLVATARTTQIKLPMASGGSYVWRIKAVDTSGNYSANEAVASVTVVTASAPVVTQSFLGDSVVLSWPAVTGSFATDHYDLRTGGTSWATAIPLASVGTTLYSERAVWSGTRNYWIAAVDTFGNVGPAALVTASITPAPAPAITQQVIDNTVLLYWNQTGGSLPTATYEIRKGPTWVSAALVGAKAGGFTTIMETVAGSYTYWVCPIDTAGNYGTPGSVAATVSAPPDYVLKASYATTFSGTRSAMAPDIDGGWVMPVNATETVQGHFTARAWNTPQDQVNGGFPLFIQPNQTPGYYEEVVDYGSVLAGCKITVSANGQAASGSPTLACDISVSSDGVNYTLNPGVWQVYATNFRYVKYRLTVRASDSTSLYKLAGANVRLDVKLKNDGGTVACNASDVNGTNASFAVPFLSITSITLTPAGTTPLTAVYNFSGAANPTGFAVFLFNSAGQRVSGNVSWSAKGY